MVRLFRNWQLKLGAMALATILYTGLVFSGSFHDSRIGGVPISRINQPSGAYVITTELPPLEIEYRRSNNAVAPVTVDSFAATVDLSDYDMQRPGQPQSLKVTVKPLASGVSVLNFTPSSVTVTLDVLASKEVAVRVEHGAVPAGLELGTATLSTETVTARGPSSFVSQVADAEARVSIDASGIDFHSQVDLRPVDANGNLVPSVDLTPGVVTVDIPVTQVETSKTVPISAVLGGAPAAGYTIDQVTMNPPVITLRGTPTMLADVTEVSTETISVAGLSGTRTFSVGLLTPAGLDLAPDQPSTVTVRVAISAEQGSRTFLVGITCTGAAAGVTCLPQSSQVALTLSGPIPVLAGLSAGDITPVVNVSGLPAGQHQVTPTVNLPSAVSLVSISPGQVTVVISQPPTPSPGA